LEDQFASMLTLQIKPAAPSKGKQAGCAIKREASGCFGYVNKPVKWGA
jgi:hypothetical protein